MLKRFLVAAFAVLAFAPLPAPAAPEVPAPAALVAQMNRAVRDLDYQGSFVYERDGRIDALRIFHAAGPIERERLVSVSGPRSEVIRSGPTVTCLPASERGVLLAGSSNTRLLPLVPRLQGRALQHYALRDAGTDRVAGYPARVVEVVPRDAWRYGYRLWIEDGARLLLRSAVIDARQRTLEQFMFVALEIGAAPRESDLAPVGETGLVASPDEESLRHARWRVAEVPPGFFLARLQRPAKAPDGAEHQVYSDGIANVSVYIEPAEAAAPPDRDLARGVISLHAQTREGWRVTAVGDVPRATVARMAGSVEAIPAPR
ncbi:MAG: MucB/RseB C-terminal domain-containing protein [Xanthomonadales bacterium]|nr:MucB/RseB C-terminal domain-containing protein [Xanthomonadales bacterium]